jgi:hypothetical protein
MRMQGLREARRAKGSESLDKGVRLGLVAFGLVHLLVAWLALQLLGGGGNGKATQQGAFAQLAQEPVGLVALFVVAAGFFALVVWQGLSAAVGHRHSDGAERFTKRLVSGGRALVYAALGVNALTTALSGGGSGGASTDGPTAQLMSAPGGQLLVGAIGLGILAVGGVLVFQGVTANFVDNLDVKGRSGDRRIPIVVLGRVGYVGKGLSLGAVGVLFVVAAIRHRPDESGGLDAALHELLGQPFGGVVVAAVGAALGCFGLYCFAWAGHLRNT